MSRSEWHNPPEAAQPIVTATRSELLAEIAAQLLATEDPRPLLGSICASLAREIGAGMHALDLTCSGESAPVSWVRAGIDDGDREAFEHIIHRGDLMGSVLTSGAPLLLENIHTHRDESARALAHLGASCCALYPVRAQNRMHGVAVFILLHRPALAEGERQLLESTTDLIGASLDRSIALAELRHARDAAEAKVRARDDFLAVLSRELRTPLNPVLLIASDAAENPQFPAAVRREFASIHTHVKNEARIIDELLDLMRVTRGTFTLETQELDVHDLLLEAIRDSKGEYKDKPLRVRRDLSAAHTRIQGDPQRMRQVFWNVLKNAFKFTPDEGSITISTSNPPGERSVRIQIVDTGIGMTPEAIQAAFEGFSQETSLEERQRFGGLGLGLAITRMLVHSHGGTIHAQSTGPGLGTTVTIALPTVETPPATRRTSSQMHPPSGEESHSRRDALGRRILVVDDHAPTLSALSHLLRRRRYTVTVAAGANEALERARNGEFDFLLSDLGLPDGDGFSVMRLVKDIHPEIRGIAISGFGADNDLEKSRRAGFSAHLVKPVSARVLETTLEQIAGTVDIHGNA